MILQKPVSIKGVFFSVFIPFKDMILQKPVSIKDMILQKPVSIKGMFFLSFYPFKGYDFTKTCLLRVECNSWANHGMGHFPFITNKLKFQWVILSKFNIAISVVNGPLFC